MIQIGNLDEVIKAIRNDAVIECAMLIYGLEAETPLMVTNSDLVSSTFTLDRYCQSADSLEIGSACAAELSFSLLNYNGKFTGFKFEGAKIIPRLRIKDITSWITIGEFVIDEKPKQLNTIHIVALDRMVVMDKAIDWTTFAWSSNSKALVTQICDDCDIVLASDALDRLVSVNIFTNCPTTEMTYRQLLQQVMQFSCCNAFINEDGKLDFAWYKSTKAGTGFTLTTADRFTGSVEETSLQPNSYIFKTVNSNGDEEESIAYTNSSGGDFDFVFESNELANLNNFNSTTQLAIAKKNSSLGTVRAFTATTLPFFFLQPMDEIIFVTADGEEISTTVTHFTFKLNAGAKIECKLPTMSNSGYASLGALTAKEKQLINSIRLKEKQLSVDKAALDTLTAREEALLSYNKAVNNGVFLDKTEYNGQVYYHNGDTLEESTYIMVQNSEGTYWTNQGGWDSTNDPPVTWEYTVTSDGTAILSNIFAYYICADVIKSGILISKDGGTYFNLDKGEIVTNNGTFKTEIKNGKIARTIIGILEEQFDFGAYLNNGMTIYCTDTKIYPLNTATKSTGFRRSASDKDGNLIPIVIEDTYSHQFHSQVITCSSRHGSDNLVRSTNQQFAGFKHYRYVEDNQYNTALGIGAFSGIPTTALELKNSSGNILARIDFYEYGEPGAIKICGTTYDGTKYYYSTELDLTEDYLNVVSGDYYLKGLKLASASDTAISIGNTSRDLYFYGKSKIYCYKKVYMPYGQVLGTSSVGTTVEETGEIVIPDSILDYFENSEITVQPSLLITTQSTSSFEIDEETGEMIEIITPGTTTEEKADAYFASMDIVPDILKDEEETSVNLFTMVHIEWKAIQELNTLLKDAQLRIKELENQLAGGQTDA